MAFVRVPNADGEVDIVEKDPINDTQVSMAKLEIEKLHPIMDAGWEISFPWLCCLVGKYKNYQKKKEEEIMLASGVQRKKTVRIKPEELDGASLRWEGLK